MPRSAFTTPSGRELQDPDLILLKSLGRIGSIELLDEARQLKGGSFSSIYVKLREELTDDEETLRRVGRKILYHGNNLAYWRFKAACFIGVPHAGTRLAQEAAQASIEKNSLVSPRAIALEMRKEKGDASTWLMGPVPNLKEYCLVLVENAVTSGNSILKMLERLKEDGIDVERAIHKGDITCMVFVDRQQGGMKNLKDRYPHLVIESAYRLFDDIVPVFERFGVWTPEQCKKAKHEGLLTLIPSPQVAS